MSHILDEELYQAGVALAACPTAACHEGNVYRCLLERLKDLPHVTTRFDEFGNLFATYRYEPEGREPFRLVAHTDHPAFVVGREGEKAELRFAGGVEEERFAGKKIVFHHEETTRRLGRATITGTAFSEEVKRVEIDGPIPTKATFAVWDLPKARCTKRLFFSPACDDLVEVAVMLALLRRLALGGAKAHVEALFTRAEEVGFYGALAAMKSKTALSPMATISLEASNARGFAKVEGGPILRVGDRLSVFNSQITHWLDTAFRGRQAATGSAPYQRLLMAGGTCEASVFHRAGLPTGALCVALNNYHNHGPGKTIRAESIALRDWQGLYDFLHFLATEAKTVAQAGEATTARFVKLEAKAVAALSKIGH
jgi:putative aminopeptidase FrvX